MSISDPDASEQRSSHTPNTEHMPFFFWEVKYERILSIVFDINIVLFHFVQHKIANFAFVKVKYCLFLSKLIFVTTNI